VWCSLLYRTVFVFVVLFFLRPPALHPLLPPPVLFVSVCALCRTLELQFVRCLVKKFLPINYGESHEVRVFWRALAKDAPTMCAERTKHVIVEMYAATKAVRA